MTEAFQNSAPRAPYPGLRAFRREENDLFFGREGCINAMVDRLAATRFLAVLGSSGTGKSSLVKTGLLDGLELGLMAGAGSRWRIVEFRPGGVPLRNLARGLLATAENESEFEPAQGDVDLLRAFLDRGPRSVIEWCRGGHLPKGTNLLLLVDQFEELFRYQDYAGREEAEAFVALLLESARTREFAIYVAITMRSEYLGACALIEGLADAINAGLYLTPRMTRELCREAIVGPAEVCDIDIEPALVNRLLNDLASFAPWDAADAHDQLDRIMRRADQLPLLQYTLNRMWLRALAAGRNERVKLMIADYEAIGGLSGALNAHANQIVEELGKARSPIVERVFRTLTAGNSVAEAVRRPTRFDDLVAACGGDKASVHAVVDAFRAPGVNFLVPEFDANHPTLAGDTYIDISHESLIRQWRQLGEWLDKEASAAQQWRRLIDRYGTGELLRGRELANMLAWRDDIKPNATWARRYGGDYPAVTSYLENSYRVQRRKRLLIGSGAAAVFLTVAASAVVAIHYERIASDRLADNQKMLLRAEEEGERAKLANDALVGLFENMSANAEQRTKSGAAITIDESLTAIRQFVARRPSDPELRRFLAINLNVYGDIRLQANDTDNAHKAFEESLEIGRTLVQLDPSRFQWQEVLAAALGRVAQVKVKTDALTEARGRYEEAAALLRALIARDAAEKLFNNIQSEKVLNSFQSQLGQLGDLLVKLDASPAALAAFSERVDIYRKLVELAPDDNSRLENLSSGLDRIGLLLRPNDLAAARKAFEEELAIDRSLSQRDPNNRTRRRNVAFSLNRIADMFRRESNLAAARDTFEDMVAIDRKLLEENPRDADVLNDNQVRLTDYADTLEKLGNKEAALAVYQEQLGVRRRHLALAPENADRLRNLSTTLDKIGELTLQAGNLAQARQSFEEAAEIDRALYQRDVADRASRRNLAFSLARVADLQRRERKLDDARTTYEEVAALHRKLAVDFPTDAAILSFYQSHINAFGDLLVESGNRDAALAIFRERIEISRRHLALDPTNTERLKNLSVALDKAAEQLLQLGNVAEAGRLFAEELEIDRDLHTQAPDSREAGVNLTYSLNRVADAQRRLQDPAAARRAYAELVLISRKLVADHADGADLLDTFQSRLGSYGALLTEAKDWTAALAVYKERLEVARKYLGFAPETPARLNAVATALLNVGDVMVELNDRSGALAAYRDRLEQQRKLLAFTPDDVGRTENVSASLDKIGGLLMAMGNLSDASAVFDEELELDRKLHARNPDGKTAQQNVVYSINRVADLLRRRNDRPGAARNYEESLVIERRLSTSYPEDTSVQERYASSAKRLAELSLEIDNKDGARKAYEDQFTGLVRLIDIRRKAFVAAGRTKPESLVNALGEATWAGLLSNHPSEVIDFADEVLRLDSARRPVETNRATALLLIGRVAEARSFYERLKRIPHPDKAGLTWIEYVKDDLALLRRLGITSPDVEQVASELGI